VARLNLLVPALGLQEVVVVAGWVVLPCHEGNAGIVKPGPCQEQHQKAGNPIAFHDCSTQRPGGGTGSLGLQALPIKPSHHIPLVTSSNIDDAPGLHARMVSLPPPWELWSRYGDRRCDR
jgi:hypothetical protein